MERAEFVPYGDFFIQYLKMNQKYNLPVQHYHEGYEIFLLLSGKRYSYFDNTYYTLYSGDLVILNPFEIHYSESRDADCYERYVMNFRLDTLSGILTEQEMNLIAEKLNSCVIHLSDEVSEKMCDCFRRTEELSKKDGFLSEKLLYSSLLQLIMLAIEHIEKDYVVKGQLVDSHIISALQYIEKNYKNNITLEELSDVAHISKYHFCRIFKSVTGATVLEYINNVRLKKAHNLLVNTDLHIDKIASKTGFSMGSNLTRVFKKVYGVSPRTFRNTQQK